MRLSHEELFQHLDAIHQKYGEKYYDTDTVSEILLFEGLPYSGDRSLLMRIEEIFRKYEIGYVRPGHRTSKTKSQLLTDSGVIIACSSNALQSSIIRWTRELLRNPDATGIIVVSNRSVSMPNLIDGKRAVLVNPF